MNKLPKRVLIGACVACVLTIIALGAILQDEAKAEDSKYGKYNNWRELERHPLGRSL